MQKNRLSKLVLKNENHIKYSFEQKEAYLAVFFDGEKYSIKEGLIDAMNQLGVASINNTLVSSVLFKLTSEAEAEGLQGTINSIFEELEYELISDPVMPESEGWLLAENKALETYIGSMVFEGSMPSNKTLEIGREKLKEMKIGDGIYGFNQLRTYFVNDFVNIKEEDLIENVVEFTMKATDFFETKEDATKFVSLFLKEQSKWNYQEMAFKDFRLSKFCTQLVHRLEKMHNQKITYESTLKTAYLLSSGNSNSERLFATRYSVDNKSFLSDLPLELFKNREITGYRSKKYIDAKNILPKNVEDLFSRKLEFKNTYYEKAHRMTQSRRNIIIVRDIDYVNSLMSFFGEYLVMKEGFRLFNRICFYSKTMKDKTFDEFIESFEL